MTRYSHSSTTVRSFVDTRFFISTFMAGIMKFSKCMGGRYAFKYAKSVICAPSEPTTLDPWLYMDHINTFFLIILPLDIVCLSILNHLLFHICINIRNIIFVNFCVIMQWGVSIGTNPPSCTYPSPSTITVILDTNTLGIRNKKSFGVPSLSMNVFLSII